MDQLPINENRNTDLDSMSLDNISVSNLMSPIDPSLNPDIMNELLLTPRSKKASNFFPYMDTPTTSKNTDGNIYIHETPTTTQKTNDILQTCNYREEIFYSDSESLPPVKKLSRQRLKYDCDDIYLKQKEHQRSPESDGIESETINHKVIIHKRLESTWATDEDTEDEDIFDTRPIKKNLAVTTQRESDSNKRRLKPTRSRKAIPVIIESNNSKDNFASSESIENMPKQPNFEINISVEQCSSDKSSIEDSGSDSENISNSDTFDEIYDSDFESDTSTVMVGKENDTDEWTEISNTNQLDFLQFPLKSQITVPPNIQLNEPVDYYKLFVTKEVIKKMVLETNKHAEEYISSNVIKPKSRILKWVPATSEEMEKFMGVLMVMGLTKLPKLHLYWSKKKCYRNEYIVNLMSRDRFLIILKFWHFSENVDNGDKLYKIRNITDYLFKSFSEILKPGRFMVIDETIIPWKGRLKFRQYIKNKAHKYGIKLYKLCTPEGYTYSMIVYTGKDEDKSGAGHGRDVVMKLTKDLIEEGRTLIADNFYTSVSLAEELLNKKTFICGTVRTNRKGIPKTFIAKKIKKGQVIGTMNKKNVKIIKLMDKRPVTMITTVKEHNATLKETGKLSRSDKQPIMKPASVIMYNETKKGVDFSDQMAAYYSSLKRGLKWFRKLMMSLLFGTCLVNAWPIHKMKNVDQITLLSFLESIIQSFTKKSLTDNNGSEEKKRVPHTLIKEEKFKKCNPCYHELRKYLSSRDTDKKVKKVRTICQECKKPMCLECFNKLHRT